MSTAASIDSVEAMARAIGLLDAAEIVGKRAHMDELMNEGNPVVAQVLRHCEQMLTDRAYAIWPADVAPLPKRLSRACGPEDK